MVFHQIRVYSSISAIMQSKLFMLVDVAECRSRFRVVNYGGVQCSLLCEHLAQRQATSQGTTLTFIPQSSRDKVQSEPWKSGECAETDYDFSSVSNTGAPLLGSLV